MLIMRSFGVVTWFKSVVVDQPILAFLFAKAIYLYGIFFSLLDRLGETVFDNYDSKTVFTILTCQQYRKQFLIIYYLCLI